MYLRISKSRLPDDDRNIEGLEREHFIGVEAGCLQLTIEKPNPSFTVPEPAYNFRSDAIARYFIRTEAR